jgi:SagB-type dehydrogenase family enzyme
MLILGRVVAPAWTRAAVSGATLMFLGLTGLAGQEASRTPPPVVVLPAPAERSSVSLDEALRRRRSMREYTTRALTDGQVSQLLWAAQGITDPAGYRTAPSAGALYPLEVYVATQAGLHRYEARGHRLLRVADLDVRPALRDAALGQEAVGTAGAVFIITAVPSRTAAKYGAQRATRYVQLEAGHAAQNLLLEAVALGLGAVPIGAFDDDRVSGVLHLRGGEVPLYLIPVGRPLR